MADDRTNRGPRDRSRVNTSEEYELRYRRGKWGVSSEQIKATVAEVGTNADAIARQLGKRAQT